MRLRTRVLVFALILVAVVAAVWLANDGAQPARHFLRNLFRQLF